MLAGAFGYAAAGFRWRTHGINEDAPPIQRLELRKDRIGKRAENFSGHACVAAPCGPCCTPRESPPPERRDARCAFMHSLDASDLRALLAWRHAQSEMHS
jgi:hypothetical protein